MIKQHPTLPILCDSETGMICREGKEKWQAGSLHKSGYLLITVKGKSYRVHRLIADTFLEPEDGKPEIDHIDRDRSNNKLSNIRRCTRKDNCRNTSSYEAVEKRGWHHKGDGWNTDYYESIKDTEHHKEVNRRNAFKWSRKHADKHRKNSLDYYYRMKAAGFRYVTCPDGKRRWVEGDSISLQAK